MRDGWVETTLGEISKCAGGCAFPDAFQGHRKGIPFIKVSDMNSRENEKYIKDANNFVSAEVVEDLRLRIWDKGTVIFPKVGAALLTEKRRMLATKTIFDNNIMGLVPNERVLSEFLFLLMLQIRFSDYVQQGAVPSIKNSIVEAITVLTPPLDEQKRIVDLISSVDSYIEALQQHLESAKKSRNSVLHELLNAGGDDWEATTIGDISDFISVRKSPEQLSSDSIYVGLEHLEPNNTSIDKFDSIRKVTSSLTPFDVGDVLFGRLRPYLHKVAIAEMFGFCSPEILVLRANAKVLPQMLLLYCDADSTIKICVERSAGTRMPRTSTEDLASIEIKLPPMAEQIKLAELFNTFDTDISQIVITLEKSKILRSGLLSDLLSGQHEIPARYDKVIGAV